MTVTARAANDRPAPARGVDVDVRAGSPVRAGAYVHGGDDLVSRWHVHDLHQLVYASRGWAQIETSDGLRLLPPQQAALVPAGTVHRTTLQGVESVSVYFGAELLSASGTRILAAEPVVREMVNYASRWPIDRRSSDATADSYFATLARLVGELVDHPLPLHLPCPVDPVVDQAVRYTTENLATVTEVDVGRAIGVSARTLRRRFVADVGMPWRRYVQQRRVLAAMALLVEPGATVLGVASTVGFESPSAFNRAFRGAAGESPSSYRRRVLTTPRA